MKITIISDGGNKVKKRIAPIILLLLILTNSLTTFAYADLKIDAKAAILMDANTGEVI